MKKPKILIVEDEMIIARELEARLTGMGYRMAGIASSGEEAIRSAYETQPDLVLMDIVLKGEMDGITAADQIRTRFDIPSVYVTAYADDGTLQRAKTTQPYGYIIKPFSGSDVHAAVEIAVYKHQMETKLREEQEARLLLAAIVESSDDAITGWTLRGTIFSWNSGAERLYGYSAEEAVGQSLTTLVVPPERQGEVAQILERIVQGEFTDHYETVRLRKDGTRVDISLTVSPIRSATGEIIGASAIARDITWRKRAESAYRLSELRYRRLFETAKDGILLLDAESGEITDANTSLLEMLGYSYDQLVTRKLWEAGPFQDIAAFRDLPENGDLHCEHLSFATGDGRHIDVEFVSTAFLVNDRKVIQCNVRNITSRKQAEAALRVLNEQLEGRVAERTRELREKSDAMSEELCIAHELQRVMLPHQFPTVPRGTTPAESALQFFSLYNPSGPVSGDFFAVIPLSDTAVGVLICDVMGHNVCAALVTAMMRALVEELGPQAPDPGQLLTQINRVLTGTFKHGGSRVFATAFYLVADVSCSRMRYASAGHPSPLHVHRQQSEVTSLVADGKRGPALGLLENAAYESLESPLTAGDLVLLLTDGIFEAEGSGEEPYGRERLIAAVRQRARLPSPELLLHELFEDALQFAHGRKFDDNVCLLGMEVAQPGLRPA